MKSREDSEPTSPSPILCKQWDGGKECGREANNTVVGEVDIMDSRMPVKFVVCDKHFEPLKKYIEEGDEEK